MTVISFNKKGYDGFIDFIKAYAIIAVLIGHTVPNLDMVAYFVWLGMQVPLFLLVQAFHVFKKDTPKVLLSKIFQRVLVPFFAIEIITVILALIFTTDTSKQLIASVLTGGGVWPWLLLPLVVSTVCIALTSVCEITQSVLESSNFSIVSSSMRRF